MLSVLEKLVSLEAGKLAPLIDLDMSKYIDAEKLKAHIQHLIKKDNYELFDVPELLSFIDSLQQEQPEVDLEKEYKEYVEDDPVFSILTNRNVGLTIARHFFNLGLNARKA